MGDSRADPIPGFEPSANPQVGDLWELGRWMRAGEDVSWHGRQLHTAFVMRAMAEHVVVADPEFTILPPEHRRCPTPPETGLRYLVASARVVHVHPRMTVAGADFLSSLSEGGMAQMRAATRRAAGQPLSDAQCDEMIARLGPGVAEKMLAQTVAGRA